MLTIGIKVGITTGKFKCKKIEEEGEEEEEEEEAENKLRL
jgi:hypothetical protein